MTKAGVCLKAGDGKMLEDVGDSLWRCKGWPSF